MPGVAQNGAEIDIDCELWLFMGGKYNLEIDETTAQMSTVINQPYLEFLNCLSLTL